MGVYTNTKKFYSIVGSIARTRPNMTLNDYVKYQSNLKDGKYNLSGDIFVQNLIIAFDSKFGNKEYAKRGGMPEKSSGGELTFKEILNCKTKAVTNTYSSCEDNYFSVIDTVLEDTDNFFKYKNMFGNSMNSRTWSALADGYGCCSNGKGIAEPAGPAPF